MPATGAPSAASANASATFDASQSQVTPRMAQTQNPTLASASTTHKSSRDELKGRDTNLSFHLVAELPYEIEFAPLGTDSLLAAGSCFGAIPLLIEANKLRFFPELARFDHRQRGIGCISTVGGTWPDNTWLALSSSSDAGPSSSDVYQWAPGQGWVKKHEYVPWVFEVVPWQGNMVLLSMNQNSFLVAPNLEVRSSRGKRLGKLPATACQPPRPRETPAWLHDGTLTLLGYECDVKGYGPEDSHVLLTETWSGAGTKRVRRVPLPMENTEAEQFIVDKDGWAVLLRSPGQAHDRAARFVKGKWTTVTEGSLWVR